MWICANFFFEIHDPSQTDGIGPDLGPQYRSMIFYMDEKQKSEAEEVIELLRSKGHRVNTKLRPAEKFWEAEDYHQHYYVNPEKPDVPLNKNDAFQKVQKRRVQEKR